jgi:hypothetical protein
MSLNLHDLEPRIVSYGLGKYNAQDEFPKCPIYPTILYNLGVNWEEFACKGCLPVSFFYQFSNNLVRGFRFSRPRLTAFLISDFDNLGIYGKLVMPI